MRQKSERKNLNDTFGVQKSAFKVRVCLTIVKISETFQNYRPKPREHCNLRFPGLYMHEINHNLQCEMIDYKNSFLSCTDLRLG